MIALKVGVGVKVQRGGGGGFTKATDVILSCGFCLPLAGERKSNWTGIGRG